MTTPETLGPPTNVVQAIARIKAELPALDKNKTAPAVMGGYSYRGIEAITAQAQKLEAKYGVVWVPRVKSTVVKDLLINSKPWTDTMLEVEYDIYGPQGISDKIICGPLIGIGRDNSDKGANKAETQTFKMAMTEVYCISDQTADTDGQTHEADTAPQTRAPVRHVPTKPDLAEAKHGLKEILDLLGDQKPACVAYILEKCAVPEASAMTLEQTNQAQVIAAGWPATGPHPEQPSMGDPF